MSTKWGILLDKLVTLTEAGKLTWKETVDGEEISTDLLETKVEIRFMEWDDSYLLVLRGDLGSPVDQFTDDELTESGYMGASRTFSKLFKTVKRQNSGADQALDSIIERLSRIDDDIPW